MKVWKRAAIYLAILPVIGLAIIGTYALVGGASDSDESSFPGFRLVRPLFAATTTTGFPDPDAGLSAYIKVDASKMDLDALISKFVDLKLAGDNYVVGRYMQPRHGVSYLVEVFVYADTDGWIIAYLENTRLAADAIVFKDQNINWNSALSSIVNRAVQDSGAIDNNAIINETDIRYYHWGHPQATNLGLAARKSGGNLYFAAPINREIYQISVAILCRQGGNVRWPPETGQVVKVHSSS
jgi:hypothetical protein